MLIINGTKFYEEPTSCGTCPFLFTGRTDTPISSPTDNKGHCPIFDEVHHTYANPPRRCAKLFRKVFSKGYADGTELAIVHNG